MRWIELALILGKLLAFVGTSDGAEWSGIRAYVKHPQEAWSGSSDCAPCNRFCSDLRKYNTEARALGAEGWRVGYNEVRSDGRDNAIVILRVMEDEPAPYFVRVVDGVESDKIERYNGDIRAILKLWPGKTTTVRGTLPATQVEIQETFPDEAAVRTIREFRTVRALPPVVVQRVPTVYSSGPQWTAPTDMRTHLATSHGYSWAYLNSLSQSQLQALHDQDHNSGRVTPYGVQRWPVALAPPAPPDVGQYQRGVFGPIRSGAPVSVQRSYAASGFQVGGFRVGMYGTRVRSNCPSGQCPP